MIELDLYDDEYSARSAQAPYGISAGGVVYRKNGNEFEYLILGRTDDGVTSYHLPKGTLHIGEPIESAALREITEEAGVNVLLKTFIGGKHAIFDHDGDVYDKTLLYYAAEYIDEAGDMDNEHDFRQWCSYDDAIAKLSTHKKQENVFVERTHRYLHG